MKHLKELFLMLFLLVAGIGSMSADGTAQYDGVSYALYDNFWGIEHCAMITDITSEEEVVFIYPTIGYLGNTYQVLYVGDYQASTHISNTHVTTLFFAGSIIFNAGNQALFDLPNLTDIYFQGSTPTLSGEYSKYFSQPAVKTITAHVANKTPTEIAAMKTQEVWKDFNDIVVYDQSTTHAKQTFIRVGGEGASSFNYTHYNETTSTPIAANSTTSVMLPSWKSGNDFTDAIQMSIEVKDNETLQVLRNYVDITSNFTATPTTGDRTYTLTANDGETYWDEATWVISISERVITFADANVKAICIAQPNWDTNGDKEISYAEAALVTNLGGKFKNNTSIISFDELQYFGVTTLNGEEFKGCTNLKSITLPETLTFINSDVFCDCSSLKTLYIPKNVTEMLNGFTQNCTSLISIAVDEENANYDSRGGCNAIIEKSTNRLVAGCKNTVIPEGVQIIGAYSIYGMPITSIVIPASVTEFRANAFGKCTGLVSVEIKNQTPPTLKLNSFPSAIATTCTLIVPAAYNLSYESVETTGDVRNYSNSFKEIVEAPVTSSNRVHSITLIGETDNKVFVNPQGAVDHEMEINSSSDNPFVYALPAYNTNDFDTFIMDIKVREGQKFTVFCNGQQVEEGFTMTGVENGYENYQFYSDEPECDEIYFSWDINVFESCTWVILIEDVDTPKRTFFVKSNGSAYTNVIVDGNNVDGGFKKGSRKYEVEEGKSVQVKAFVDNDMVTKVMLNGADITNNETYLRQKEENQGQGKYWLYDFSSVTGAAFIDIIYEKAQFDVNEDEHISIADVTTLVNKILGKPTN